MHSMSNGHKSIFNFLSSLKANNNREWFEENKDRYKEAHQNAIVFADALITEMNKVDYIDTVSGKKALFRIYRDMRFTKDKTPYKTCFSGHLRRATRTLRGGYYFHLEPGNSYVGGGFFGPNSDDLLRIREVIAQNARPLRAILNDAEFREIFGKLQGDKVKTSPRGFSIDHPDIDLIRYKQFYVKHTFTDKEVLDEDFVFEVVKTYLTLRPYFNYMSEILTVDVD
jgi:uncharacterized protein (TIGR02453 family)